MGCIYKQEINTLTGWCRTDLATDLSRLKHFITAEIATFDLAVIMQSF